jgi:hypothetical protein
VGLILSPAHWGRFAVELDYVQVSQYGVIGQLPAREVLQDVENFGAESRYVGGHAGSLPGFDVRLHSGYGAEGVAITAPGQVAHQLEAVYLTNPKINLGDRFVEALDVAFTYQAGDREKRAFVATVRVASVLSHRFMGGEAAGRATQRSGTIPRWSAVTNLVYRHHGWEFGLLHRAVASVYAELDRFETGRYDTVDLSVGYRWGVRAPVALRRLELSLRVKNAGDAGPRRAPATFTSGKADLGTYDALGRTWQFAMTRRL